MLLWCKEQHTKALVGIECRKDMAANAEIRVAHVCAFVSTLHFKSDASEIFRVHGICDYAPNEKEISHDQRVMASAKGLARGRSPHWPPR